MKRMGSPAIGGTASVISYRPDLRSNLSSVFWTRVIYVCHFGLVWYMCAILHSCDIRVPFRTRVIYVCHFALVWYTCDILDSFDIRVPFWTRVIYVCHFGLVWYTCAILDSCDICVPFWTRAIYACHSGLVWYTCTILDASRCNLLSKRIFIKFWFSCFCRYAATFYIHKTYKIPKLIVADNTDKSLARPGRKQARKHFRDARDFNNIETRAVIKFTFSCKAKRRKNFTPFWQKHQLVSFLVGLRTYQHPCISQFLNNFPVMYTWRFHIKLKSVRIWIGRGLYCASSFVWGIFLCREGF